MHGAKNITFTEINRGRPTREGSTIRGSSAGLRALGRKITVFLYSQYCYNACCLNAIWL